jgi:hypothetical protein
MASPTDALAHIENMASALAKRATVARGRRTRRSVAPAFAHHHAGQ